MQTKRVIALGFFDGVHIGHGALLSRTRELAAQYGCIASAFSFDASPGSVISGKNIPLLSSVSERKLLMRQYYGIGDVQIAHFDRELMELPWRRFVTEKLVEELSAAHLVCGHDFRFGYRGEGDPERLRLLCAELGIGCDVIGKVTLDGITVSSTHIRTLLQNGDIPAAVRFLGHPQLYSGTVEKGAQLGRTIGFPTANLPFAPSALIPPFGVYAAKAELDGNEYPALVNIGLHPTAEKLKKPLLEAHLLGFDGDLYGRELSVWLYSFIRPERRFDSLQGLQKQILTDKKAVCSFFHAEEGV